MQRHRALFLQMATGIDKPGSPKRVLCDPRGVIFGNSLSAPASTEPAGWIGESIGGEPWTVGTLVPNRYETLLRLHAPDPTPDGWWELYRDLFVLVASLGARHTTTPEHAWFAIWEGHGFDTTHLADVPLLDLPNRAYYLTRGPLSAMAEVRYPNCEGWRNPDLFWPDDRSWFAATDVDFWSLYVGGSETLTNELADHASASSTVVRQQDRLPIEN